jgi:hypothetical protein
MRTGLILGCALALLSACGSDDHSAFDPENAIVVNEASDEVLIAMVDAVDEGKTVLDDTKAEKLTAPVTDAKVPVATPVKFTWAPAGSATARHGTSSGNFTWLRFEAEGYEDPIDVIAVGVSEWTPSADEWARLTAATGAVTVTVTNAYVMSGIVKDGPFRATAGPTTFSFSH